MAVAAELTGLNPQSIRVYEVHGLVRPARTAGGTRQFSDQDIDRLERIRALLAAGLNLAGVAMVVDLERENSRLRRKVARLEASRTG
jgi:DNA-binding transcriptional MerR regulator